MPAHLFHKGNDHNTTETPPLIPTVEVELVSSSDTLSDHRLQPQTIQWNENAGRFPTPRRGSSSTLHRPRVGAASRSGSLNPERGAGCSDDSDSERDFALASPTLPPSAMPSPHVGDNRLVPENRSFKDLELPLPGITESPREELDPSLPTSSGFPLFRPPLTTLEVKNLSS